MAVPFSELENKPTDLRRVGWPQSQVCGIRELVVVPALPFPVMSAEIRGVISVLRRRCARITHVLRFQALARYTIVLTRPLRQFYIYLGGADDYFEQDAP